MPVLGPDRHGDSVIDGINEAPGLKAADIGLSVEGASGVAQAAAHMILFDSYLVVGAHGVDEGPPTGFAAIQRMVLSVVAGLLYWVAIATIRPMQHPTRRDT